MFPQLTAYLMILNLRTTINSRKTRDGACKLGELYRRRVMGGCLRGGGAYKLLRKEKRRKKKHVGEKAREREKDRGREGEHREVTSLSSQDIQGHSVS